MKKKCCSIFTKKQGGDTQMNMHANQPCMSIHMNNNKKDSNNKKKIESENEVKRRNNLHKKI